MSSECCFDSASNSSTIKRETCKHDIQYKVGNLNPLSKQILASSVASALSAISLNPLNVVKVQYQNSSLPNVSIISTAQRIYMKNGIRGFLSGSRMGLIQAVPNTVCYMVSYEYLKSNTFNHLSSIAPLLSGMLARCIAVSLMTPLELIRTIQLNGNNQTSIAVALNVYKNEGIKGFYKGWSSTLLRDAPFSGIYWFAFETIKAYNIEIINSKDKDNQHENLSNVRNSSLVNFVSGGISALIAACLTHPYDVIKTRRQLSSLSLSSSSSLNVIGLIRQEGVLSMYKGLTMRLAMVVPSSAILVTVYEAIKYFEYNK